MRMTSMEQAADALRLHEMKGRMTRTMPLNEWAKISKAQKAKWMEKAEVVVATYQAALCKWTVE